MRSRFCSLVQSEGKEAPMQSEGYDVAYCLARVVEERAAAGNSRGVTREDHLMSAERWADTAWSLNEADATSPPLADEFVHFAECE
jgi:hypothetical protein